MGEFEIDRFEIGLPQVDGDPVPALAPQVAGSEAHRVDRLDGRVGPAPGPVVGERPLPLSLDDLTDLTAGITGQPGVMRRVEPAGTDLVADGKARGNYRLRHPRSVLRSRPASARNRRRRD